MCWPNSGAGRGAWRGEAQKATGVPGVRKRPDARLVDVFEHRIGLAAAPVLLHQLGERLVGPPAHAVAVEHLGHLGQGALGDPGGDEGGQRVTALEPVTFLAKVESEGALHGGQVGLDLRGAGPATATGAG